MRGFLGLTDEFLFVLLLVIAAVALWKRFSARAPRARPLDGAAGSPPEPESEEETLRRLCDQIDKMEKRLENLETILLDRRPRKP